MVAQARLALLDGFELRYGDEPVRVPTSTQRVLAYLALHEAPLRRQHVAGALWLDTSERQAAANLRSALWRLRRHRAELVDATPSVLQLAPAVSVDVRDMIGQARRLLKPGQACAEVDLNGTSLQLDVLPDWYEDWALVARERVRLLRLHALESLCRRLTEAGRFGEAVEAAQSAVAAEPLRESAHRALIAAHLAEGNLAHAVTQYRGYARLLDENLGAEPSPQMEALVTPFLRV